MHGVWYTACVLAESPRSHAGHRAPFEPKADTQRKMQIWGQRKRSFYCSSRVASVLLQSCPSLFLKWTLWALPVIGHSVTY